MLEAEWNGKPAAVGFTRTQLIVLGSGFGNEMSAPYSASRVREATGNGRRIQCHGMDALISFANDGVAAEFDAAMDARTSEVRQVIARAGTTPAPVLVVTTNEIAGYQINAVHGDVFGLIVRARNVFSNIGAGLRTVVGGEVGGYTKLLQTSRLEARARLIEEARRRGANAVVAMRFDCNEIGDIMSEIACYGTAVTVTKLPGPQMRAQASDQPA